MYMYHYTIALYPASTLKLILDVREFNELCWEVGEPAVQIMCVTENNYGYDRLINKLKDDPEIIVSIEGLGASIKEHVLLALNDNGNMGLLLKELGMIKSYHGRLGCPLYILEGVKKEYAIKLAAFLKRLYDNAIDIVEPFTEAKISVCKKTKEKGCK